MSTTPIQASTALQQLAQLLLGNFDANKDGQLNLSEFSSMLSRMSGDAATPAVTTAGAATTPVYAASVNVSRASSAMEGFDAAKIANTSHRTPKYIFARVAMQSDLSRVSDKASAEATLRGMIPNLQQAGLAVLDVDGDKIKINHEGQDVWIDVVRGASSGAPAFQWMPV